MYCIETEHLTFTYANGEKALDNVSLQVPEGCIYGFLGPNGAGKTTTLRLILGLLANQQGKIELFGKPFEGNRLDILRKLGSLIESPSIYSHLTARENLRLLQKIYRCPETRIAEVLSLVGLASTGSKKAGQFSLGMKQRLSIAIALLHKPSLLILDEPTNGLDPNGIIEMRELLRKLNREDGITILVSSHLLPEVEKLVTHTGIIHKGKLLFQGTLAELSHKQKHSSSICIDTDYPEEAIRLLHQLDLAARLENQRIMLPVQPRQTIARINRLLVENGKEVYGISTINNDLESVFMNLVND